MKKSNTITLEDIDKTTKSLIGDISFQKGTEVIDAYTVSSNFNNYIKKKYGAVSIASYSFSPYLILIIFNPAGYRVQLKRFMRAKGWQKV